MWRRKKELRPCSQQCSGMPLIFKVEAFIIRFARPQRIRYLRIEYW